MTTRTPARTTLADEHRQNISAGVKKRWKQRRKIAVLTDEVVVAARAQRSQSVELSLALSKLDRALASD